jgi:hypothetical protein
VSYNSLCPSLSYCPRSLTVKLYKIELWEPVWITLFSTSALVSPSKKMSDREKESVEGMYREKESVEGMLNLIKNFPRVKDSFLPLKKRKLNFPTSPPKCLFRGKEMKIEDLKQIVKVLLQEIKIPQWINSVLGISSTHCHQSPPSPRPPPNEVLVLVELIRELWESLEVKDPIPLPMNRKYSNFIYTFSILLAILFILFTS